MRLTAAAEAAVCVDGRSRRRHRLRHRLSGTQRNDGAVREPIATQRVDATAARGATYRRVVAVR